MCLNFDSKVNFSQNSGFKVKIGYNFGIWVQNLSKFCLLWSFIIKVLVIRSKLVQNDKVRQKKNQNFGYLVSKFVKNSVFGSRNIWSGDKW